MEGDRKARWGRQPTRLDVERNVNRIIAIKDVMDQVNEAAKVHGCLHVQRLIGGRLALLVTSLCMSLQKGDCAAIDAAIGDLSIESTKKNINLGIVHAQSQTCKSAP